MMPSKFSVTKEIEFDAGHRVPDHKSKCSNPHGHRYKITATVRGDLQTAGSSNGMVLDFGDIKEQLTKRIHDKYDHGFIVFQNDFDMMDLFADAPSNWKIVVVPFVPTAENLAKSIYDDLYAVLTGLSYIDVYETPTSIARYPA